MRNTESLVEIEKPEFEVDLRIAGVAQDVISKDEEQMRKIEEVLEKSETVHTQNLFGLIWKNQKIL